MRNETCCSRALYCFVWRKQNRGNLTQHGTAIAHPSIYLLNRLGVCVCVSVCETTVSTTVQLAPCFSHVFLLFHRMSLNTSLSEGDRVSSVCLWCVFVWLLSCPATCHVLWQSEDRTLHIALLGVRWWLR